MYLCSVGIAFGHWPGTVHVTSVKEKKKHPSSSLSSLVLHVSSVSLSVCFVSAHAVSLTYSGCCQSTSNLKRKKLDHQHSLVYHSLFFSDLSEVFSCRVIFVLVCYVCDVTKVCRVVTPEVARKDGNWIRSEKKISHIIFIILTSKIQT